MVLRVRGAYGGFGLGYVGDADLGNLLPASLPGEVEPSLRELAAGDRIVREQVTDLLRCNFFRQSVLCRDARTAAPDPTPDAMYSLTFAARAGGGAAPSGLLASALEPLRAHAPETIAFGELRRALGGGGGAAGRGAAGGLPHRACDAAHRAAARRTGRGPGPAGGEPARPLAGGAGTGGHEPRLHQRAHGGAGRAGADHAARRQPRPGRGAGRVHRAGGLAVAALIFVVYAIGFLFAAAAVGLSEAVSLWLTLLIVGVALLLIAALGGFLAMRFARKASPPKPEQAIQEGQATIGMLSDHA